MARQKSTAKKKTAAAPVERIAGGFYVVRGQKVMLDEDVAGIYEASAKSLMYAIKRHPNRFPEDFAFRLSEKEFAYLRSHVTSNLRIGRRFAYVFTPEGILMLSSILRTKKTALINVNIVRVFTRLGDLLKADRDLARRIDEHDSAIMTFHHFVSRQLDTRSRK